MTITLLAFALALPVCAMAQTARAPAPVAAPQTSGAATLPTLPPPRFIAPNDVNLARVLPAFPTAGSIAERADIETMLSIQLRRSKADEDDAMADSTTTMVDFTKKLLGPSYSPATHPKLFEMMAALHNDMRGINRGANAAKGFRVRPTLYDPRIRPSLDMVGHGAASYPSARASSSGVWAYAIGELFPEHKVAAIAEAERVAWRRVVGGVHYPSDLAGSRIVIQAVTQRLSISPAFAAALVQVRGELARVPTPAIPAP